MINSQSPVTVERCGISGNEGIFHIKSNAKAFEILSSSLYSDKILAIVRELSCNAYDSHVSAGKSDVPIEIHLPTILDPVFYVRDYGTGLSCEQVVGHTNTTGQFIPGIYQTFFDSNKTDSNDFIGTLGLGSKSPFSYTSQFTVESRHNGTHYVFLAFKNEEGVPSIVEVSRTPTTEGNGLTVSLSVRSEDISKFFTASKMALMYFDPAPRVLGRSDFISAHKVTHTVTGTNWKIREADYYAHMNGPRVVQGFVSYPIASHMLNDHARLTAQALALSTVDLDLYVPIGQIDVAPSREALSYNKRTCLNLIATLESAALEMRDRFQAAFDECTTRWEMLTLLDKFNNSDSTKFNDIFKSMNRTTPFTWNNGEKVSDAVNLSLTNCHSMCVQSMTQVLGRRGARKVEVSLLNTKASDMGVELHLAPSKVVVLVERTGKALGHAFYQAYQAARLDANKWVIVIRSVPGGGYSQPETQHILDCLGNPPFEYVDDVVSKLEKPKTKYVKRDNDVRLVWTGFTSKWNGKRTVENRNYSRLTWTTDKVDLNEGGYFVVVDRFTPMLGDTPVEGLDLLIESAQKMGYLPNDIRIWGFNRKDAAELEDDDNWINVITNVALQFEQNNEDGELIQQVNLEDFIRQTKNVVGSEMYNAYCVNWDHWKSQCQEGPFKVFCETINRIQMSSTKNTAYIRTIARVLGIDSTAAALDSAKIRKDWSNILTRYPMLSHVSWYGLRDYNIIMDYINLVDKNHC